MALILPHLLLFYRYEKEVVTTNNKDIFLSVRLKPEDKRKLDQLAEESGLSVGAIIRRLIHETEIKPQRQEGLKELGRRDPG